MNRMKDQSKKSDEDMTEEERLQRELEAQEKTTDENY